MSAVCGHEMEGKKENFVKEYHRNSVKKYRIIRSNQKQMEINETVRVNKRVRNLKQKM